MDSWLIAFFITSGFCAGIINAIAGGGPILTLAVLSLTGVDPRIANLTSTVALAPGQLVAGWEVRQSLNEELLGHPAVLLGLAMFGGSLGAALLLATSSLAFDSLVPWLVLLATAIYAFSETLAKVVQQGRLSNNRIFMSLFAPLTLYGGYFGGGNSFLVLALLGFSGHEPRRSAEIKNVLIAAINLGAVLVFSFSGLIDWPVAISVGVGGLVGSFVGAKLLGRLSVSIIRFIVILSGLMLSAWMFAR